MARMTLDGRKVRSALSKRLRPELLDLGFEKFDVRHSWRRNEWCVDLITFHFTDRPAQHLVCLRRRQQPRGRGRGCGPSAPRPRDPFHRTPRQSGKGDRAPSQSPRDCTGFRPAWDQVGRTARIAHANALNREAGTLGLLKPARQRVRACAGSDAAIHSRRRRRCSGDQRRMTVKPPQNESHVRWTTAG
jgi:hypothetical protein